MKSIHIFAILAALAASGQIHANEGTCPDKILGAGETANAETAADTQDDPTVADEETNEIDTEALQHKLFRATATWVRKNKRVPTVDELATQMKMGSEAVEDIVNLDDGEVTTVVRNTKERYPDLVEYLQRYLARQIVRHYKWEYTSPSIEQLAEQIGISPEDLQVVFTVPENMKALAEKYYAKDFVGMRAQVAKTFSRLSKDSGRFATPAEVATALSMTMEEFHGMIGPGGLFESDEQLKELAQTLVPNHFLNVVNTDEFDEERRDALVEAVIGKKRLILTTAVAGIPVEAKAFQALLVYAKANDAEIIVFPANMQTHGLDPVLLSTPGVHVLTESIELSPWLRLDNIKLLAKQINPLMGLDRMGNIGQSVIVGSPKMHVKTLPSKSTVTTKKLLTTGAITRGHYSGPRDKYIKQRTSRIAKDDHVIGALILEKRKGSSQLVDVESAGHFFMRHIEYIPEAEGFVDLGVLYSAEGKKRVGIETGVLGDVHVGMTDERLMASLKDQILKLKPKTIVLHDLMDGRSINHHEKERLLTLAQKSEEGLLDIERELDQVAAFVNSLLALNPSMTIVVVPSNHDAWLHTWLDSGQFMKENHNRKIGLELALIKANGKDVFREAILSRVEYPKRVNFLERGKDFRVGPDHRTVELGQHGDKGTNGSKPSLMSFAVSFGRVVFGHTHTDARRNGSVNIGTFTPRAMPYSQEGTSTWAQTMALVDPYGGIQTLEYFDGGWYSRPEEADPSTDKFFWPQYPKVVPNDPDTTPESLDQWSW